MTETEHLLQCLAEECAEVQQRISKALRFGLYEIQPDQDYTNQRRIMLEIYDLMGVLALLQDRQILSEIDNNNELIRLKKAKVLKFLQYAREQKAVKDAPF